MFEHPVRRLHKLIDHAVVLRLFVHDWHDALRREGGFGFVEEVEALAKPVFDERDECFAVRLFVEQFAAVAIDQLSAALRFRVEPFDFGSHVKQAFRP